MHPNEVPLCRAGNPEVSPNGHSHVCPDGDANRCNVLRILKTVLGQFDICTHHPGQLRLLLMEHADLQDARAQVLERLAKLGIIIDSGEFRRDVMSGYASIGTIQRSICSHLQSRGIVLPCLGVDDHELH